MIDKYEDLIREALRAEKGMQDLYDLYKKHFSEDADFWKNLAEEEKTHWSLINMGKDVLTPDVMEEIFLFDNLEHLKEVNDLVESYVNNFEKNLPKKEDAYNIAIRLEKVAYEIFYQEKMKASPGSSQMEIFQKLNNGCKDHADRIREVMLRKQD
ncbi:hypothetical protein ACFL5Y_00635 [Candidatus Omnitrophota bacterium]